MHLNSVEFDQTIAAFSFCQENMVKKVFQIVVMAQFTAKKIVIGILDDELSVNFLIF